jgi:hypothetical protein
VLAYVKNGKTFAVDHYGTSPVGHAPDERLGGRSDLRNVFGSEENGVTEVGFSIPLRSGDTADSRLDPATPAKVLLAYSAAMDNFRSKHSYRQAFEVNLETGEYRVAERATGARKARVD